MAAVKRATASRWLPAITFVAAFLLHAFYVRHAMAGPSDGWADAGITDTALWGFRPYLKAQDYYVSFSYALAAAFAVWAITEVLRVRRAAAAAGAVGGITFAGIIAAGGCFLIGCCGSPMLGVYLSVFGATALGLAKPLTAVVTGISVALGYWCVCRCRGSAGCGSVCGASDGAVLQSVITCAHCGHRAEEKMPTNACLFFYDCPACATRMRPKPGDCCVFCSYGSRPCPPVQLGKACVKA